MASASAPFQTLRIRTHPSLSLSSKLPLSSAFSVSLRRRRRNRPLVVLVSAGLDAKPTVLVAEKLGEAGLQLLKEFANVDCSYNLSPEELCTKISLCDALIVRSGTKVTREVFESSAGRLKVVGRADVGIDNVDLSAATEHCCLVVNAPTANTVDRTCRSRSTIAARLNHPESLRHHLLHRHSRVLLPCQPLLHRHPLCHRRPPPPLRPGNTVVSFTKLGLAVVVVAAVASHFASLRFDAKDKDEISFGVHRISYHIFLIKCCVGAAEIPAIAL